MANEYISVEDLKARIGFDAADTVDEEVLEQVIEAASRAADEWCNRRFYTTPEDEDRYFTAWSWDYIDVADVLSVTEMATDDLSNGSYSTTWAESDFYLAPRNAQADGTPYSEIRRASGGQRSFGVGRLDAIRVTGKFGFAEPPATVKEAVRLLAARFFKRKDSPLGVAGFGDLGVIRVGTDSDVADLLNRWRIIPIA